MSAKRMLIKVPILLVLAAVLVFAFTRLPVFSENAMAPFVAASVEDYPETYLPGEDAGGDNAGPSYQNGGQNGGYNGEYNGNAGYNESGAKVTDGSYGPEEPEYPEELEEPLPEPTPPILIRLGYEDIFSGNLILVNRYNVFHFPSHHDLVLLAEHITENSAVHPANQFLSMSIIPALNAMLDAFHAETGRTDVAVRSAFRGEDQQRRLFEQRVRQFGEREAQRWVARPGYSEHHAGLAIDFGIFRGGHMSGFTGTGVYSWFRNNAHYFGFILRYPSNRYDITRVAYEPWHFRYVGVPHAHIIRNSGFVMEEYIQFIRIRNQHYKYRIYIDDVLYEVFFTSSFEIELPAYSEFTISGNNIDGFIVTIAHRPDVVEDAPQYEYSEYSPQYEDTPQYEYIYQY